MTQGYFWRVRDETPTRLWVNNPTLEECDFALAQGAVGCTTNPAFAGNLLRRAPEWVRASVAAVVESSGPGDSDLDLADRVQQHLVAQVLAKWLPLWEETHGAAGFVSIQGSPEVDHDHVAMIREAREARELAPNATPKLPATLPGLRAFDAVVAAGHPTIITEVFSLDQLIETCERYERVTARTGVRPPFFMSPITGIFGDHLKKVARRDGIDVATEVTDWAGVAFARACQRTVRERAYPVTLLFGGARVPMDFTGLVGDRTAATINYSTVEEILALDPRVDNTIVEPVADSVLAALSSQFDDFRRAMTAGSLTIEEFEGFGPLQHFRDVFVAGWRATVAEIRQQRTAAKV